MAFVAVGAHLVQHDLHLDVLLVDVVLLERRRGRRRRVRVVGRRGRRRRGRVGGCVGGACVGRGGRRVETCGGRERGRRRIES